MMALYLEGSLRSVLPIMAAAALLATACASDGGGGAGDAAGPGPDAAPVDAPGPPPDAGADTGPDTGAGATPPRPFEYTEEREPCSAYDPLRSVYFGDLHVHTALSFDAAAYDVRTTPHQAYAFARGEPVGLPPLGPDGRGTRIVQLERPLDFVALTDHSELLAETSLCLSDEPVASSPTCKAYKQRGGLAVLGLELSSETPEHPDGVCGDGARCERVASDLWTQIQQAAEDFYDRTSACEFTTFVAYEYSGSPGLSNIHRNVIFRNATVPALPTSYFDEPTPEGLWAALRGACLEPAAGCDVLAIPHNSNWSNGRIFAVEYPGASSPAEEAEQAAARARIEPLVEIFQHKGDSECSPGLESPLGPPDELCGFEKLREPPFEDCGDTAGSGGILNLGCVSRLDFVRNVLAEGLVEQRRLGENPFKLGIIAGTDTHNGTPGAVAEDSFEGHVGLSDGAPEALLAQGELLPGGIIDNPGGLAGVWAEERSRDALFEALRRRETFGTSGPRMAVRFFAGWNYPAELCAAGDLVEQGYAGGVPMGGDLPPRPAGAAAPTFVLAALRDPGTEARPGGLLQRAQIVKGWVDAGGERHTAVHDVAGDPDNGASVDLATCTPTGAGADSLCAVWTDPDFDPSVPAFWYARVVENPSCRYSTWTCISLPPAERPPACSDPDAVRTIQERAWTSPVWYTPPAGAP